MSIRQVLNDPLAHFLAIGLILFLVLSAMRPEVSDDEIHVTKDAILEFIQFRTKAFEPDAAAKLFDTMPQDDKQKLIDEYIHEEALFREATQLNMDIGDYVIRRRMVQKIEFLVTSSTGDVVPTPNQIEAYFGEHKQDYAVPATVSFTHIYFSKESIAQDQFQQTLSTIKADLSSFEQTHSASRKFGDRFLFNSNYVDRTYNLVKSHFGNAFTKYLFAEDTQHNRWIGPINSKHGIHFVFVSDRKPGGMAILTDIQTQVENDTKRFLQTKSSEAVTDDIIQQYKTIIDPDLLLK